MKTYCIVVKRELEEDYIFHSGFLVEPTKEDVLVKVEEEGLEYDDDYGKLEYWEI